VNGLKEELAGKVDVVHLSLVSRAGREVGSRYGIRIVPTSLLFDSTGELLTRVDGVPKKEQLSAKIR
jgi:thioredoxin-related protein